MGNVVGADFSYASKLLLDRVQIVVVCDSYAESTRVAEEVVRSALFQGHKIQVRTHGGKRQSFHVMHVLSTDVEAAIHLLGQYRSIVQKVALCGNPTTTVVSTLESLLPEVVIYELEHDICLKYGESVTASLSSGVFDIRGESACLEENNLDDIQDHLHVTVHSTVSYHMYTSKCDGPRYVGTAPMGCSSVIAIFNRFIARHGTEPKKTHINLPVILELAREGSTKSCDMLVYDIYGGVCEDMGLSGEIIASSFGKLHKTMKASGPYGVKHSSVHCTNTIQNRSKDQALFEEEVLSNDIVHPGDCDHVSAGKDGEPCLSSPVQHIPPENDFAHSLVQMLVINITHHASLHARLCGVRRLVFSGAIFEDVWICELVKLYAEYWSRGSLISHVYGNSMFLAAFGAAELINNRGL